MRVAGRHPTQLHVPTGRSRYLSLRRRGRSTIISRAPGRCAALALCLMVTAGSLTSCAGSTSRPRADEASWRRDVRPHAESTLRYAASLNNCRAAAPPARFVCNPGLGFDLEISSFESALSTEMFSAGAAPRQLADLVRRSQEVSDQLMTTGSQYQSCVDANAGAPAWSESCQRRARTWLDSKNRFVRMLKEWIS